MYVYVGVWSRDLYWEALTEDRTTQNRDSINMKVRDNSTFL